MSIKAEFTAVKAQAVAIVEKAKAENRPMTAEEKIEVDGKFARCNDIRALLKTENDLAALELDEEKEKDASIKDAVIQAFNKKDKKDNKMEKEVNIADAVRHFGRTGKMEFGLTSGSNSGALMPKSILGVSTVLQTQNPFRKGFAALGFKPYSSSSSENGSIAVFDDVATVANNDQEGASTGATADVGFGADLNLNLSEYHSKAQWFTKKLANAFDFDILAAAVPAAINRIERAETIDWTAKVIAKSGIVGVTTNSPTAVVFNEMLAFDESLPPAYDDVPAFYLVSKGMRYVIRSMADSVLRPYISIEGGLTYLFGRPVFTNASLGTVAATNTVAMLVTVSDATVIRDYSNNEIQRYEGESGHPGSIGIEALGWSAFDCSVNAIRTLKMHA